jgi:DNA mismatch repair protein MutS2
MNGHAVRLLEFELIREELTEYAWGEDGKARLQKESFITDREELETLRRRIGEFRRLFLGAEERPSLYFPDIVESIKLADKPGAALDARELGLIGLYLRQGSELKKYLHRGEAGLKEEAEALPDLLDLSRRIGKIVDPEGNIRDNEIPSLAAIRRRIRSIRKDLDQLSFSYLNNGDLKGYWQSDSASQKDGRIVLPLNANFKGRIRGVVHEISSRGATAFFEPLDIFEKNNELVEEENEYRIEVLRLLRELTAVVGSEGDKVRFLMDRIALIDSWQARARYSHLHSCFTAETSTGDLSLRKARHPLLGKKAVPIDIEIVEETRILIVTGPNTGGKTVALKTAGLLALMNQFGLDLPVEAGSRLPLFDDIFLDIGDEQSIAESLSTFSAHMKNLSDIAGSCTAASLVLLDELGSGTDPEQGAALAMAFLDRFLQKGCLTIVTTHLGVLKNYAFTKPGTSNASVDFDPDLIKPTYRILPGIPGSSHALDIAERHGVPPDIIEGAKAYIDQNETDSGRLINNLMDRQKDLTRRSRELESAKAEMDRKSAELAGKEEVLLSRESELRTEGLRDLNGFLLESRREVEQLIREIREGRISDVKTREARAFIEKVKERAESEKETIARSKRRLRDRPAGPLEPGMEVLIGPKRRKGVLGGRLKNGRWQVVTGAVRLSLPEDEIFPATRPDPSLTRPVPAFSESYGGEPAKLEIDLRGMRYDEAVGALEKQIDRSLLQGLFEFGVIHGKGEGILQKAVHDYLRGRREVLEYSFAAPEAGGFGKTQVRLKG